MGVNQLPNQNSLTIAMESAGDKLVTEKRETMEFFGSSATN